MAEINRSLIGKWGPEGKMRVEFGKIREFARAVKEDNPLYFDEALCLAPPTFLMTMALWIGGLGESRSAVKLDLPRVLHGEQEFEYVKPIHGGDVLTFRSRTKEVFEKDVAGTCSSSWAKPSSATSTARWSPTRAAR